MLYAFLARQFLLLSDQTPGAIGISIQMVLDLYASIGIRQQGSISTRYPVICIRKIKSDEAAAILMVARLARKAAGTYETIGPPPSRVGPNSVANFVASVPTCAYSCPLELLGSR